MSSRPISSVREVLESIAGSVKTTVEDLTGETGAQATDTKPKAQKDVRAAAEDGTLAAKLKDPTFLKETNDWLKAADPKDPAQRADMVKVLKALDPSNDAARKKVFELTFDSKIDSSTTRKYVPRMTGKKPNQTQAKNSDGSPAYNEIFDKAAALDPAALDAMTDVMAQLPTRHMPKRWNFTGQDADDNTRGSYDDRSDGADLAFSLKDSAKGFAQEYASNCLPGDPLAKAKAFDVIIRHECGHKASTEGDFEGLTKSPGGGKWVEHGTIEDVLKALAPLYDKLVEKAQDKGIPAEPAIRAAILDPDNGYDAAKIAAALKIQDATRLDHPLLQMLGQGGVKGYQCGSTPVAIEGRMYIVGGPDARWFSFEKSAWDKRVSLYQYATPNEWFAEFYATANNGDAKLREEAKKRYPDAWKWLNDRNCIVVG